MPIILFMIISLEETAALLDKRKEESAPLMVAGENPSQDMPRGIGDRGLRWTMSPPAGASRIETERGLVEFEGPVGNVRLSLKRGHTFVYADHCNALPDVREAAEALALSALSLWFPSKQAFLVYQMREPVPSR